MLEVSAPGSICISSTTNLTIEYNAVVQSVEEGLQNSAENPWRLPRRQAVNQFMHR